MSQELVGRVEETAADSRIVGDLPHENKEGDDRQVVGTEDGKEIPCKQVQGGVPGGQEAETHEADDGHDESDRDSGEHQNDEDDEAQEAGGYGRHGFTVRIAECRPSTSRTRTSRALPAAIP